MPNVMAAQPNIGGSICENSVIPLLVPRHKVWLTSTARVPCGHTANAGERKTWTQSEFSNWKNSVRGKAAKMYIGYSVPAQETTKSTKFGWHQVSDVAAVTKQRRETG